MVILVQDEMVPDCLLKAEELNSTGELKAALVEIVIAFQTLFDKFEWRAREQNNVHLKGVSSRLFSRVESTAPKELSRFAKEIEHELDTLHKQVQMLSLGIDYRRYIRFQGLTPIVYFLSSGTYETFGDGRGESHQGYLFCSQFVIECALRLQEIQFF
jgi:hypothetical protein